MTTIHVRTLAPTLVLGLCLAAAPAQAQRHVGIGFSAGLSIPTGNTSDFTSAGFNVAGLVDVPGNPRMPFGLRFEGQLNQFSGKNSGDPDYRALSLTGNIVLNFTRPSGPTPYVIGGLGLYNGRVSRDDSHFSRNDIGLNGGAGVRFPLSGFSTFAEIRFHKVFGSGRTDAGFVPLTFGVIF